MIPCMLEAEREVGGREGWAGDEQEQMCVYTQWEEGSHCVCVCVWEGEGGRGERERGGVCVCGWVGGGGRGGG